MRNGTRRVVWGRKCVEGNVWKGMCGRECEKGNVVGNV